MNPTIEIPARADYRLVMTNGQSSRATATVTITMSREQALAMAYQLNRYLAETPEGHLYVHLPVEGTLIFD